MADSLFPATAPPVDFDDADAGAGLSLYTLIIPQVAGFVTHVRRYRSATAPAFEIASVWSREDESTGDQLGESIDWVGSAAAVGAAGWDVALLDDPIFVPAFGEIYAGLTTNRFVSAVDPSKPFKDGDVVSAGGLLVGPADDAGTPRRNGRFASGATPAFPDSGGSNCYYVDIVFEEAPPSQPLETVTGTGVAGAFGRIKRQLVGVATGTGTVASLGRIKRRALGTVLGTGVAGSFGGQSPPVPGTLTVRQSTSGLTVRESASGLTIREV